MELTVAKSSIAGEENRAIVALAGVATVNEVEKIKQALLAVLADCDELLLDIREITGADAALLQLMHATRLTAGAAGIGFTLAGEFAAVFHDAAISAGFLSADDDEIKSAQALSKE